MAVQMRIAGESDRGISKRMKFTLSSVKAAKCPATKGRTWYYDTEVRGLALMVSATGSKSFYLYRKVLGKPQQLRLGGAGNNDATDPDITIEQARKNAQRAIGQISEGRDPMAEKRTARAKSMTLGQLWTWYLENWAKPRKRSWVADESRYENHLKSWESKQLTDITRTQVAALHQRISESASPTTANRVIVLLSTMYSKSARIGLEIANPCKGVEKFAEQSRERFLGADELKRFFDVLETLKDPNWRDFFKVCLYSGQRRGNVLSMAWSELNLNAAQWHIPPEKFKNGKAMVVHLPAPAVEILQARWDVAGKSPWVFPGPGSTGHLTTPTKPWAAVVKNAKLPGVRIHDLRRTLGSWQAAGGSSLAIIGKSLGHRTSAATMVYARLELNPIKQSVDAAVAAMTAAANSEGAKAS